MTRIEIAPIQRWLTEAPHVDDDGSAFVRGLGEALRAAEIPVWRVGLALMTKHPEVLWLTLRWRDGAITTQDQPHARLDDPYYTNSAVAVVRRTGTTVRVPLVAGGLPYPICEELRDLGGTDYVVLPLRFTNGTVSYISVAANVAGGFPDDVLAALDAVLPALTRRIELESAYYATRALLEVYLGKNAARRVVNGKFQRGDGELIECAIWFSDMRGFTAFSDRNPPAAVVAVLDRIFDTLATAISAHGGEVLKFIGDAVLAIFPLGTDSRHACREALAAAEEGLAKLPADIHVGVALHRGTVMYGNIGARDRLDFTVISSAVNEASRLESLCKDVNTSLALSEAFVKTAELTDAVDLGAHALKGVSAPIRVYTTRR